MPDKKAHLKKNLWYLVYYWPLEWVMACAGLRRKKIRSKEKLGAKGPAVANL